jgi:hypothetical protein
LGYRFVWVILDPNLNAPERRTTPLVAVLTPEPIIRCIRQGFIPEIHPSANALGCVRLAGLPFEDLPAGYHYFGDGALLGQSEEGG